MSSLCVARPRRSESILLRWLGRSEGGGSVRLRHLAMNLPGPFVIDVEPPQARQETPRPLQLFHATRENPTDEQQVNVVARTTQTGFHGDPSTAKVVPQETVVGDRECTLGKGSVAGLAARRRSHDRPDQRNQRAGWPHRHARPTNCGALDSLPQEEADQKRVPTEETHGHQEGPENTVAEQDRTGSGEKRQKEKERSSQLCLSASRRSRMNERWRVDDGHPNYNSELAANCRPLAQKGADYDAAPG